LWLTDSLFSGSYRRQAGFADVIRGGRACDSVVAAVTLRRIRPKLIVGVAALLVLTMIPTGIGHLITAYHNYSLMALAHTLAAVLFGIAGWRSLGLTALGC
jgi:hypothetical protein